MKSSKNKQKILLVANSTWNIHNFRRNILRTLLASGFDVVVVTPIDSYLSYLKDFPTIRHIPLKNLARKSTNPIHDLRLFLELNKIFKKESPNLILNYTIKPNIWGGMAAAKRNIPYICVVTGLGYAFLHNGFVNFFSKILYRLSFKNADKVVFENIDDRVLFNDLKIVAPEKSISVKGCGIDVRHFRPKEKSEKNDHEKLIFTFIGRFLYDKGIKEFVEAAKILLRKNENAEFWLVGEIDHENPSALSEDELQNWIETKIITYHGLASDVRKFIKDSDCIVLPSYREAIPRVIQEGMSMQRCVITTDVSGCREAVENNESGFLVTVKDPNSLADAMKKIIDMSPTQRREMAKKARLKVELEFDEKIIAKKFLDFVNEILKN